MNTPLMDRFLRMRERYITRTGKPPQEVKMMESTYRELCSEIRHKTIRVEPSAERPTIYGMKIVIANE